MRPCIQMYVMKRERNSGITRIKKGKTVAFNIEKSPKNISAFKGHLFPLVMLPANVCEGLPLALSSALVCLPTCFLSPLACCFILYACFFCLSPRLSLFYARAHFNHYVCACAYMFVKKKKIYSPLPLQSMYLSGNLSSQHLSFSFIMRL